MITKRKILILAAVLFFSLALPVFALEVIYPPVPGAEAPQDFMQRIEDDLLDPSNALPLYIKYFYHLILSLSGLACFFSIVTGAFFFFLPGDSATRAKEGRERINLGFIGLLLMLSSYLFFNVLNPDLLSFTAILLTPPGERVPLTPITLPPKTIPSYVEIPLGGLIQIVERRAALTDQTAAGVESTSLSVSNASQCLNRLTALCQCDPNVQTIPDSCTAVTTGGCTTGECADTDPCDIPTPPDVSSACSSLGITVDANLRIAITNQISSLQLITAALGYQRQNLITITNLLNIANNNLRAAEALMRDARPSTTFDRNAWASLQKKEIRRIWPFDNILLPSTGTGSGVIEYPSPPGSCQGECPYEIVPSCAVCGNTLFCYGNGYRGCETDALFKSHCNNGNGPNETQCVSPPPKGQQAGCCDHTGPCVAPRTCTNDSWYSADNFPSGTVLYNGMNFPVPANGVYVCDSNVFGCNNESCH